MIIAAMKSSVVICPARDEYDGEFLSQARQRLVRTLELHKRELIAGTGTSVSGAR